MLCIHSVYRVHNVVYTFCVKLVHNVVHTFCV